MVDRWREAVLLQCQRRRGTQSLCPRESPDVTVCTCTMVCEADCREAYYQAFSLRKVCSNVWLLASVRLNAQTVQYGSGKPGVSIKIRV